MPKIVVDGAQINVETEGAGPALVLLHGFTGSAASWAPHIKAFASRHLTVAVDLLGHGQSDAPADPGRYGLAHCVEDVLAVLDSLEIRQAAVLGYSMGGRAALAVAVAAPERVSALILESASPGLRDPEVRMARAAQDALLAEAIERDGVEAFVEEWERQPLFASQTTMPDEARAALRSQRLRNRAVGLANSLRGFGQGTMMPMHDFLAEIAAPTLVIAGALDERYVGLAREMSDRIPGAHLQVVEGAGHAVHLEQPETFQRLVLEFLSRVSGIRSR
ncbi:MAG: 2-succinyl-6-hydroxy-2,4-cyclohexadiene-1-carboxylate synthase [Armatimonadota bacterium]|nr:2-succinyl-6-hydroxy-2,4-cyclohexadiene-1-carboxylate synthase [Armatimonadota bacterium]